VIQIKNNNSRVVNESHEDRNSRKNLDLNNYIFRPWRILTIIPHSK